MELSGIDLNLLVAFDALMTERSVTRAASRIGLSQPGMSNALARLRKLTGDPLLVREGPALVPTPRARELRHPVREALTMIQAALGPRPSFDPARDAVTFTVSCSDYSLLMLIGPLVRHLAAAAPAVTIRVLPRSPDAVRLIRDGDIDVAIEPAEIMPEVALASARLWADRWLCCVWEGNSVAGAGGQAGGRLSVDAYLAMGHLVYSMGHGQPVSMVDEHLARSMVPRRIEFTVESFLLAPFLLEGTDLVTVVPEKAAPFLRRTAAVRLLEPPVPLPSITEMLWWHPRNDADPAHGWIRARIAGIAATLDSPGGARAADSGGPGRV